MSISVEYDATREDGSDEELDSAQLQDAKIPEKHEKKAPVPLSREPGKSLFPFSRVQKIIKADKDLPMVAKEATFLISLATEEFIKRLTEAGRSIAERDNRATVQHRDIATVIRKADEFMFLDDIIHLTAPEPTAKKPRKPKALSLSSGPTLLDQFIAPNDAPDESENHVVMNEDGTMLIAGD